MASQRNHYEVLGIARDAGATTIDAAYHGRSLRFRVGLFDDRPRDNAGPTRAEIEAAYATLSDPARRAEYDAELFGSTLAPAASAQRRSRPWPWVAAGTVTLLLLLALVIGGFVAAASRRPATGDPVSRILGADTMARATLTARADQSVPTSRTVAAPNKTLPAVQSGGGPIATAPSTATVAPAAMAHLATATLVPVATTTSSPTPMSTTLPTSTMAATSSPTIVPAPSSLPATPTVEPRTATPIPPPPPFPATDRIGTAIPVNLRAGPGTYFVSLVTLSRGTLLAATGASRTVGGYLWREFWLASGLVGWVRDIDVLPVP